MVDPAPTPAAPVSTDGSDPSGNPKPAPPAAESGKQPPWGAPENFTPEKAWELIQNLRNEKADPALKQQVEALTQAQETQRAKFAEALGLAETPKSEDDLTETVKNLQAQFEKSQLEATRLRLAANPGVNAEGKPLPAIPPEYHDLLTETDPEKLKAQAEKVGALVAANLAAAATPEFQANPGQGKGSTPPPKDDSYPSNWLPKRQQQ